MDKNQIVTDEIKDEAVVKDEVSENTDAWDAYKIPVSELKQSDKFKNLFPRDPAVLEKIEADKTAKAIGTSTTTVEKARQILKSDNPELIQAVKSHAKSIHKGSQELAASKPAKDKRKRKTGPDYKGVIKALKQAIKCCDTDKDIIEAITKVIDQVDTKMKEAGNTAKAK